MPATVDVTIPVLNEEADLERNVLKLREFHVETFSDPSRIKIVIADNGSTDGTRAIGERMAATEEWLQYIRLEKRGVGMALKKSWEASEADIVGYMDLDLATDISHFPTAIRALTEQGYDVVYATRFHCQSKVIGRSMIRGIVSRIFNLIVRTYLGTRFSDGMCGFKFLRRDKLLALRANGAVSDGWFFSTELLVVSEWLGLKLYELPVTWRENPNTKARIVRLAVEYLMAMRLLRKNRGVTAPRRSVRGACGVGKG